MDEENQVESNESQAHDSSRYQKYYNRARGRQNKLEQKANQRKEKKENKAAKLEGKASARENKATNQAQKAEQQRANGKNMRAGANQKRSEKNKKKAEKLKKKAEKAKKQAQKAEKFAKFAAKIGKFIATIGWIIIIIFIIIGLLVFVLTGLGFIWEGILKVVDGIGDGITSMFQGSEYVVEKQDLQEVIDYIHELGYDIYTYGFVTTSDALKEVEEEVKDEDGNVVSTTTSIEILPDIADDTNLFGQFHTSNDTGEESYIEETASKDENIAPFKYLLAYIVSDNYSKILRNENWNITGLFDTKNEGWGSGLIYVYHDDGVGDVGSSMKPWSKGDATVEDGYLIIKSRTGIINKVKQKYKLDGWTGRYGMPLEFLLSTHVATMAPDLSYKLATSFDTEVQVLLQIVKNADIDAGIRFDNDGDRILEKKHLDEINDVAKNDSDGSNERSWERETTMKAFAWAAKQGRYLQSQKDGVYICKGPEAVSMNVYDDDKGSLSMFRGAAENYNIRRSFAW